MNLSTRILGSTAVRQLEAATTAGVLQVGSDRLTRSDLAAVGCFNFLAARNLSALLQGVPVKNLRDLYTRLAPGALALPHMGVISLAVLGAAFEAKGIGGETPLESWVRLHTHGDTPNQAMVTFYTLKKRELSEHAAARRRRRRRRAA